MVIETIKTAITCNPFISIRELSLKVSQCTNVDVSRELVRTVIKKNGFTKKKARYYGVCPPHKTDSFLLQRKQYIDDNRMFLSIDETSFGRNGINTRGYAKKGHKLHICKTPERVITTSAACCVSSNGLVDVSIKSGSFNTTSFVEFLKSLKLPRGAVVLMDNVSFHRSCVVKETLDAMGVDVLYTPPYSPWFNPIEMCFSIVKRKYYKTLAIHQSFDTLNSSHTSAFFRHSLACLGP